MRILIGLFSHETNTFCRRPTTGADFRARRWITGPDLAVAFAGTRTPVGGFLDVCRAAGVEVIPTICMNAPPGGRVTREAFEAFRASFSSHAQAAGAFDGILLSLHGAMALEDSQDGEGDLLAWMRETWGSEIPIVSTLDFHGNITPTMVEHATALFSYDEYPHTDGYDRGLEAARCIIAALRGEQSPRLFFRTIPILCPLIPTEEEPMREFLLRAHRWEEEPGVIAASVMAGFPWADVAGAGMTALCVSDGDPGLGQKVVTDLAARIWARRDRLTRTLTPVDEAVEKALSVSRGTVLLADVADNSGAGCPSDGTALLQALLDRGAERVAVAVITDPETVASAREAGVGGTFRAELGGKMEPDLGGPIVTEARVKALTDGRFRNDGPMNAGDEVQLGATATIEIGRGIEVVVTERRVQPLDRAIFPHAGVDLKEKRILVIKSSVHYRASFSPRVDEIIEVDAPGLISMNFHRFAYQNIPRPIYPLDPEATLSARS